MVKFVHKYKIQFIIEAQCMLAAMLRRNGILEKTLINHFNRI